MALSVIPKSDLDSMKKGEEVAYTLDTTNELSTNTISEISFKIYDSSDVDVTTNFGGGSSVESGVISFGVKAYDAGAYTIEFIVTCNEFLPDGVTPYEFIVIMTMIIT